MSETPACLSDLSAPMIAALIALHLHGEAERQRNYFVQHGDRHPVRVITALATRGLTVISFRAGQHRARLTDKGKWYARTAVARWSGILAA